MATNAQGQYRVRFLEAAGVHVCEEVLSADSASEVRERLTKRGCTVLGVDGLPDRGPGSASRFEVAAWCRELETLLRAGMSPVEAIETLAAGSSASTQAGRPGNSSRDAVHATLLTFLQQGAALSKAMRSTGAFPEVLLAGVTASERTSKLADALHDFLRYDNLLQQLRRQVVSAALYPALVVTLGAAIAAFLLLYVIPRFSRMYGTFQGPLSPPTELVLALSQLLRDHGLWVAAVAVAALFAVASSWRSGHLLTWLFRAIEVVPPLRAQLDHFRLAQLYQALAFLVRGGYTVDEAMQVAAGMALGQRAAQGLALGREQVARGRAVSTALHGAGLADAVGERLLRVGERGGAFADILQTIAERHSASFSTFVERATRLLEPVLLLAVALVIGSLVVMMYMPIFDIAGGLEVMP